MVKNPLVKDILREVWNTKGRFVSMLMLTMLGAMMVVGIRGAAINMRDAAHNKFVAANLYDLQLRRALPFGSEELLHVRNVDGVHLAEGTFKSDKYTYFGESIRTVRITGLMDYINQVELTHGRMPTEAGEIAVEWRFLRDGRFELGDSVNFLQPAGRERTEEALDLMQAVSSFEIVGVVRSPLYLTNDRGITVIGDGNLNYYAYVHGSTFPEGVYTDIYILMEESRNMHQMSVEYNARALYWRSFLEEETGAFVLTRQNGVAFESYFQDSLRLDQVGRVFPIIFFLVAILVTLTAVSRMVEEGRGQLGIYKALGYSGKAVLLKYVFYTLSCGFVGGIIGSLLGSFIIPRVIFDAYEHLYNMPYSTFPVPWNFAFFATGVSTLCILITALLTCLGVFRGEAAELMRPKAPKPGKRVILEYIPFLWRRLGFINKVTARNILRYKRRFIMSLVGVAGCSALVLTAFGLRDSIGSVARLQFEEIIRYDFDIRLRNISPEYFEELLRYVDGETLFVRNITADAFTDSGGFAANVVVPYNFGKLRDFVTPLVPGRGFLGQNAELVLVHGVLVSEKLAREMGIAAGDYFSLLFGQEVTLLRAAGIVENYVLHFVYMPPEVYESMFGAVPIMNGLLVIGGIQAQNIMAHPLTLGISSTASQRNSLRSQTDALGVVTIVILVMASVLAFVVLYNLTEINIIERKREIATVKVLGFYDSETAMYLYRENFVVTLLGIALGLFSGIFLNSFVLSTMEIDFLKFPHIIHPSSFLFAALLSLAFALLVNAVTYFKLVNIDMAGALKSVE